ncbi:hypothetical protein LWC34_24825 [Kibdelosporangium philippinense]|uniref:DUF4352 domain-containing protein n=1 Tax=Kibdelosporangium philippinense TaxID=211113 RepID=A0ABS8ZER1_9PSEU|nr:hypothetical protein [Kibdelosporangium philippinense]MCE7006032.1 hypothetical protein [Kibdelosporangium philippinense]
MRHVLAALAALVACKPSEAAFPQNAARAVKVTYKITNGTDKPFSPSVLSVGSDVQFAGAKAETLIDVDGPCKAGLAWSRPLSCRARLSATT